MSKEKMGELFDKGDYNTLSTFIEEQSSKSTELQVEGLIYRSQMMSSVDRMSKGQKFADQAIEICVNNKLHELEIKSLIAKGFSCGRAHHSILNSIFTNIEMLLESKRSTIPEDIMQKIDGDLHFLKAWYYTTSNQNNIAWEEFNKALSFQRSYGTKASLCNVLLHYGFSCIESSSRGVKSLDYLTEALKLAEDIGNPYLLGRALNWYGGGIALNKNAREGIKYLEKSIIVYDDLGDIAEMELSRIYNNMSIVYKNLEEFEKSLEYIKLALSINEKTNQMDGISLSHSNLSHTYDEINELDKAIFHMKKALDIAYQINQQAYITNFHIMLGWQYLSKGDINLAEKEFLLVENRVKEISDVEVKVWGKISLLNLHTIKMQTEKAFDKIDEIKTILGDVKSYHQLGWMYLNEGINFRTIGKFEQAIESFHKTNDVWSKIPDADDKASMWRKSNVLFHQILLMNELSNFEKAKVYFDELIDVTENAKSLGIILRNKFLEGLLLKASDRISEKFKAQTIFQEIVDEKIFDFQIYSLAMLNLCDLLILEMKISPRPEDRLKELTTLVEKMSELGRTQDILNLRVMGEVIHGKIQLVQNQLESAKLSFKQAQKIAEEHNLVYLLSKVRIEQDYMENEIAKWQEIHTMNLTLNERIEKAQIHEYLSHAISVKERIINTGSTSTN